jgi:pilus assembly protein Flp/PilA
MLYHKKERAQGMVEYALLIVLLVIVCVALIAIMGDVVGSMYSRIVVAWPIS